MAHAATKALGFIVAGCLLIEVLVQIVAALVVLKSLNRSLMPTTPFEYEIAEKAHQ